MPCRAYLIDGDIYYSPNCDRDIQLPGELNIDDITSFNNIGAEAFEVPYWWSERVPWLGFMPRRPVCWNGALVEDIGYMPRHLLVNNERMQYMLPLLSRNRWLALETLIREVLGILSRRFNIQYLEPYSTRKWGYANSHPTEAQTWQYAHQGRDWFAMWIALLYWMLRTIPEDPKYLEGISPMEWYKVLVMWDKSRISVWESLRCAPLLQHFWDANRSGVFLHNPEDQPSQPSASWFDHCGMPIWYRWGPREIAQSQQHGFRLMVPSPEILQAATTVISSVPSFTTDTGFAWEDTQTYESHFTPASPEPMQVTVDDRQPPSSPSQISKLVWKNGRLRIVEKSGRDVWEEFEKKHQERHQRMLLRETPSIRQTRLNRERNPPVASVAVYVWEWSLDTPPKFVRTLVPKRDRNETITDARPGEARYDSFCNEWTLCSEWVDESYEESDEEGSGEDVQDAQKLHQDEGGINHPVSASSAQAAESTISINPPVTPVATTLPTSSAPTTPARPHVGHTSSQGDLIPVPCGERERAQLEVLDVLKKYYGFLPPQGLPTTVGPLARLADIKGLLAITGTTAIKINNAFWATPMGHACTNFGLHLANKEDCEPPAAVWDLSSSCRDPLKFSPRLRCIKRVRAGTQYLYMFDFGDSATVPWNIAVYTASAALMICRLHHELRDEDIAVELVQSGVPFRTLQKRISLKVVRDELPCATTPMILSGHVFTLADYDFWKRRCQSIFVSRRGRAALLRGGYVWRIALDGGIGISEALKGPSGLHYNNTLNFCAWDKDGMEYVDDDLTKDELDLLCGVYESFTGIGNNIKKQSWYPLVSTFEGNRDDQGRWHLRLEENYLSRRSSILNEKVTVNPKLLLSATQWRDKTRGFGEARRSTSAVEKWSTRFLDTYCGA